MSSDPELTAALEAALVRELRRLYDAIAERLFAGRLKKPVLVLSSATRRLGQWSRHNRTLEISRTLAFERPWLEVQSVLEHEMAHQYVDEVLGVRDESPHGETFHRVCKDRGIDARAAGMPAPAPDDERALDKIRKLLALAGSDNRHEAETAMKRAHELMLRHNIEEAAMHARHDYEVRHLGTPHLRTTAVEADIVGLLAELFFVEVIRVPVYLARQARRANVYEVMGTRANVEMAVHVHAFLLATAERLWRDNRGDARVRSGRDRIAYQVGVIRGFRDKLLGERVELRGTGLVWVGDRGLEAFFRKRYPRTRKIRRNIRLGGAHAAGREAGRKVVLHKPVERGGSSGPKLLG